MSPLVSPKQNKVLPALSLLSYRRLLPTSRPKSVNMKQRLKRVEEMLVIKAEPLLSNQVEHHAEPRDAAGNH